MNFEVYLYEDFWDNFINSLTAILYTAYSDFQKAYYGKDKCEPLLLKKTFQEYALIIIVDLSCQNNNVKSSSINLPVEFETDNTIEEKTAAYWI